MPYFKYKHKKKYVISGRLHRRRGIVALMLVLCTSMGLMSVLFGLVNSYGFILTLAGQERGRHLAHSAELYCRDLLYVDLLRDARYDPSFIDQLYVSGTYRPAPYSTSCSVVSLSSSVCRGVDCCTQYHGSILNICQTGSYGEIKTASIVGKYVHTNMKNGKIDGSNMYQAETKFLIIDNPAHPIVQLYSKETSEFINK